MPTLSPTLPLERELGKQIYQALQGPVVENIVKTARDGFGDDYWRSRMEGHCMKVDKEILPEFYTLCQDVKKQLRFSEPVDFYITGDSTLNAFSIASEDEGQPHIVNINSALFDLMGTEELRFVIGHELGHIINKDSALKRLIYFVFPPDSTNPPITLQYKIRLHDQLAELVADRYGYMANGNLNACVTAFYKMSSGLDLARMNVSIDALLEDGMDELINILLKVGNGPLDEDLSVFMASAGLIVANADDHVTEKEIEHIIQNLANLQIFPKRFLDAVAQSDVSKLFDQSVQNILSQNPGMRDGLLAYMMGLVMSDKEISEKEISLVYSFGGSIGFSEKEISQKFAEMIQRNYVPSLESIC